MNKDIVVFVNGLNIVENCKVIEKDSLEWEVYFKVNNVIVENCVIKEIVCFKDGEDKDVDLSFLFVFEYDFFCVDFEKGFLIK